MTMTTPITKRAIALLLALLVCWPPTISAQSSTARRVTLAKYNLNSLTAIGCLIALPQPITTLIATSGSSTTTAAVTASSAPFQLASVGDLLIVNIASSGASLSTATRQVRVITAKASADSVTVDTAWTIPSTGLTFQLAIRTCAADGGWIPFSSAAQYATIQIALQQMNVATGGVGFKIEGKFSDEANIVTVNNLWPGLNSTGGANLCGAGTYTSGYCVYTTASNPPIFSTDQLVRPTFLRVVMILTGTDDAVDTGAAAEIIDTVYNEIK